MATTATTHQSGLAVLAADRTQSAAVFLVSVYRYIWTATTRKAATAAP